MAKPYYPNTLWDEIVPGLYQGGTDDYDVIGAYLNEDLSQLSARAKWDIGVSGLVTNKDFDTVATLYVRANAPGAKVKELRYAFLDGDMSDIDPERDLHFMVREAHADWKSGKRVLIRCQAGMNRSGLVMALVLIREGYTAAEAIKLIRRRRCEGAITNRHFEDYLLTKTNVEFWRRGVEGSN